MTAQIACIVNYDPSVAVAHPSEYPRIDYLDLAKRVDACAVDLRSLGTLARIDEFTYRTSRVYPLLALRGLRALERRGTVYVASEPVATAALLWQRALRGPRHDLVMQAHHPLSPKLGLFLRAGLFDGVRCFMTLSGYEGGELAARYPRLADALTVLRLSVDTEFYAPTPATVEPTYVAAIGSSHRDYETFFEAARLLPHVPFELKVGSTWVATSRGVDRSSVPPNVTMSGFVSPDRLRDFISRAACVAVPLLPSSQACAGCTTTSITQALGRVPVATHLPGLDGDYVSHGKTGLLVQPRDPRALADAIDHIWKHPDEAAAMGQRGRAFVEQELALDLWMEKMVARLGRD